MTWFGTGPVETYPDRRRGGAVGRWTSTVTDQFVPYTRPQENGGHAAVRWVELSDGAGRGFRLELRPAVPGFGDALRPRRSRGRGPCHGADSARSARSSASTSRTGGSEQRAAAPTPCRSTVSGPVGTVGVGPSSPFADGPQRLRRCPDQRFPTTDPTKTPSISTTATSTKKTGQARAAFSRVRKSAGGGAGLWLCRPAREPSARINHARTMTRTTAAARATATYFTSRSLSEPGRAGVSLRGPHQSVYPSRTDMTRQGGRKEKLTCLGASAHSI